jgi:GTPase SAR1 family protein
MEESWKSLLAGLDYAGKTSIMLALNEQKGYIEKVKNLKPTVRVDQVNINFLGKEVIFWDLGGQERYRNFYNKKREFYFAGTNVLFFIIDIQDEVRFTSALTYLSTILSYFEDNDEKMPVVISFHKFDPDLRNNHEFIEHAEKLEEKIREKHSSFELLFQKTSVYDIVSIVRMISYGLAVLNEDFFELYELLEEYSGKLESPGIFLLNGEGMIICNFFKEPVEEKTYEKLTNSVKQHIYELKDLRETNESVERKMFDLEDGFRSYLHPINYRKQVYYMSILLK